MDVVYSLDFVFTGFDVKFLKNVSEQNQNLF